jgi:hypothetical protein
MQHQVIMKGQVNLHCRVRETVQIFRDTVLPSKMEEGKQQESTCHFISMCLDKSVFTVKEEYLHVV